MAYKPAPVLLRILPPIFARYLATFVSPTTNASSPVHTVGRGHDTPPRLLPVPNRCILLIVSPLRLLDPSVKFTDPH
eukprot:3661028-Rhodomonas_salina.2